MSGHKTKGVLWRTAAWLRKKNGFAWINDKLYLKICFFAKMGYRLDLKNPKTYNEKLNWMKLYYRKPELTQMVDKYEVKKYVAERIGEEYIIPTYGIWDSFDEIDFEALPNQFVLKCTHDSGGLVICHDKKHFDIGAAKEKIEKALQSSFYSRGREWPYKNVRRRIIAEEYMEDNKTGELRDYKFFAFNGVVRMLYVASERQIENEETKFDFFDEHYQHLPVRNGHPNAAFIPEKPSQFEKMKELAGKLSVGYPHVRVDFYEVNGKVYFGEMTFFHNSGFVPFEPKEWDEKMGSWLELPKEKIE